MAALKQYERLEALGLWKASEDAQRIEVVVSFGNSTLVLADKNDNALAHWSLAAVDRLNPDETPAIFAPDGAEQEILEIDDTSMIDAIEHIQDEVRKAQPHPGRLRLILFAAIVLAILSLIIFWLPEATANYASRITPPAKERSIGLALLEEVTKSTGRSCRSVLGDPALADFSEALAPNANLDIRIIDLGGKFSTTLPGGIVLLNRSLVEEFSGPEVASGFALMEAIRLTDDPPMDAFFRQAGTAATLRFLATGEIPSSTYADFAWRRLTLPAPYPSASRLLPSFERAGMTSTPFAKALDFTGEKTRDFLENDPVIEDYDPIMKDADWLSLQAICEE